ncbi:MAG: histidine triad nucleotide-binding protein [Candidatus Obscuribacterales bacterium]|nr:histidine triad nucleotide-binding protein [Candidatus Obscuribacterales bacterium]
MPGSADDCIFCKIASGKIPAQIIKEGESYVAFKDLNPQAPTHLLLIPKDHYSMLSEVKDCNLLGTLFQQAAELAAEMKLADGFRLVVNTGDDGGQTVFHLHIHILGGRRMQWPPG